MTRTLLLASLLSLPLAASSQDITRTVGQLTIMADPTHAHPGGVFVVHLRRSLGTTYAILNGQRALFLDSRGGPRALVPIPIGSRPGPATLGIELLTRGGRQRIAMDVTIAARTYPPRTLVIPEEKRPLVIRPEAVTDGRRLLLVLRTETPQAQWSGPFLSPVATAPIASFGGAETFVGGSPVDTMTDAIYGEYHRGLDYEVPVGTPVIAPAAGTVVLAGPLTLSGQTLLIDHGQGVLSAFFHLSRIDVAEGERVEARAPIALSGDTGLAAVPHLHWGVYVHSVAVDPAVVQAFRE